MVRPGVPGDGCPRPPRPTGAVEWSSAVDGWWPLVIVGWGLAEMAAHRRMDLGAVVVTLAGGALLAEAQEWAGEAVIWSVLFLLIGAAMLGLGRGRLSSKDRPAGVAQVTGNSGDAMKLAKKDLLATLFVGAGAVVYLLWLLGIGWSGATGVRVVAAAVLVLGIAASASAVVPGFGDLMHGSKAYMAGASLRRGGAGGGPDRTPPGKWPGPRPPGWGRSPAVGGSTARRTLAAGRAQPGGRAPASEARSRSRQGRPPHHPRW